MPSALTSNESSFSYSFIRSYPDNKIFISASPFDWLEASLFYSDIRTKESYYDISYKDKGITLKTQLRDRPPYLSIGINDLGGTGYYGSEYIVMTDYISNIEYSFGLSWGMQSEGVTIKNPLHVFDDNFLSRDFETGEIGGQANFQNLFSGKQAAFFAGAKMTLENYNLVVEYDSTNLPGFVGYKPLSNRFSLGIEKSFKNFDLKVALSRNNTANFQITYNTNYLNFKKDTKKNIKVLNNRDLKSALAQNSIGLKNVKESEDLIYITTTSNNYDNHFEMVDVVLSYATQISTKSHAVITNETLGMEVVEAIYPLNKVGNYRNENYETSEKKPKDKYRVVKLYPLFDNKISPVIRPFIAAREGFFYRGLFIEDDLQIIFRDNFIFLGNFKKSISDNFDGLYLEPINTYPNQVRSDIKKYLNNIDRGLIIGRAEVNYFLAHKKSHFVRLSAGILEEMFGGLGMEYLYYPQGSLVSLGFETFYVKKRDYNLRLGFQQYENNLTRININAREPNLDLMFKFSYGEYLAGDEGFTFEALRQFKNGVEFGIFVSITDVTAEQFGEGSFDKGIKLKIPFDFFKKSSKSLGRFEWHPLTKDPASLLKKSVDLHERIGSFRIY